MSQATELSNEELMAIAGPPQQARPAAPNAPRGIRNNNPGNIEDGAFARSLPGYAGSDGRFARFDTPDAGVEAKARLLNSYIERGFNTPASIINRWAPPSDNNPTDRYAQYVASRVGVGVSDPVTLDHIPLLAQAIGEFENGQTQGGQAAPDPSQMSDADLMAIAGQSAPAEQAPQAPGSQGNPINLAEMRYQDEYDALKKGAWVTDREGRTYQLPTDAWTGNPDDSSVRQARNVYQDYQTAGDTAMAGMTAFAEQIPGADEAIAGAAGAISGRGYDQVRDQMMLDRQYFNDTQGTARDVGGLAGFATSFAAPGGAFIGRAGSVGNAALRGMGVGAATGAVYGAGATDGGLGERAIGAGQGAALGSVAGAAAPAIGATAAWAGKTVGRTAGRVIDGLLDRPQNPAVAQRRAMEALQATLRGDGVDEAVANRITQEWLQTGVTPNLVDLTPRGGQTQRLFRGAAARSGPAGTAAEGYLDTMAAGLQDNAINLTRRLTPDGRPADEVVESLRQGRSNQAETDYAGPYRTQVPVDDALMSALADEPGKAALRRARAAAVTRRNYDQVAEIDALLKSDPPLPMDQASRMARAAEQGFNTDATYYHGTNADFDAFAPSGRGRMGPGVYLTDDPAYASRFAEGEGANIRPVLSRRLAGPVETEASAGAGSLQDRLVASGFVGRGAHNGSAGEYVVYDPQDVRSVFDTFAPKGYRAPPPTVSAATLDRARIAMAGRARNLMTGSSARPDVAGGLFSRADDIDNTLAAVPELGPAREAYKRFSDGIEGVEIGAGIRTADPDRLAAQLANRPAAQYTAPVGAARSLETAIGTPTDGSTGLLNRISASPNMRRNLPAVFGQEAADRYQAGIGNLVDQLNNARFMASSAGSKTAGVAADLVDSLLVPQGFGHAFMMILDKLRRGISLTEEESLALVQMGKQPMTAANRGLFAGRAPRRLSGYTVPTIAALSGTLP